MISPAMILVMVVAWGASIGAAGWWAYGAGRDAEVAAQAREDAAAQKTRDVVATAIAENIPKITVKHQTIRQELEREIQTREVYRDPNCRTGPDSLRRFNSAIPAAAPGASAVPTAHPGD